MKYVYMLQSQVDSERYYTGITNDVEKRVEIHNAGLVSHTSKFKPWVLKTYIAFSDDERALNFEKYLKSGSGRAFAKKRF